MPVLDTSFVLDVLRGRKPAVALLRILQQESTPLGIAVHTLYELYQGVGLSRLPQDEKLRIEGFVSSVLVFPFEPAIARNAGMVQADLQLRGRRMNEGDLFIGCTALHNGTNVVTKDRRDFEQIPNLSLLAY